MKLLITGAAGFIGFHTSKTFLEKGFEVVGIDNVNDYYNVRLKEDRLKQLHSHLNFTFERVDLSNKLALDTIFQLHSFDYVIHLAAQAGVRYSIEQPMKYIESNVVGFTNLLECLRTHSVQRLLYASSSSVYGNSTDVPFSTEHRTDTPVSLYAATKKSNEVFMNAYSSLYGIKATGLRFFTVYGPWGRPDMAYYSFADDMLNHRTIRVFNQGKLSRDFTYIDDVVSAIVRLIDHYETDSADAPSHVIYNIGNNHPVSLETFISTIEDLLGVSASKEYVEMQRGDVLSTYADISGLKELIGYQPKTSLQEGLKEFLDWFKEYRGVS
jgi:UDP-glucuronate 4-epimerase